MPQSVYASLILVVRGGCPSQPAVVTSRSRGKESIEIVSWRGSARTSISVSEREFCLPPSPLRQS